MNTTNNNMVTPPVSPQNRPVHSSNFPRMLKQPQRILPLHVPIFSRYFLQEYKGQHALSEFKELNNLLNNPPCVYSKADFIQYSIELANVLNRNFNYQIASEFIIWVSKNKIKHSNLIDNRLKVSLNFKNWVEGFEAFIQTTFFKELLKTNCQVFLCDMFLGGLKKHIKEVKVENIFLDVFFNFFKMFTFEVEFKDLNGVNKQVEKNTAYIFWHFVEFYYFTFECK